MNKLHIQSTIEKVACPICQSEKRIKKYPSTINPSHINTISSYSYDILNEGHHPIVKCSECGVYYSCPRDSDKTIEKIYIHGKVDSYLKLTDAKLLTLQKDAELIQKICGKGGNLLEVGCATGLFLKQLEKIGFSVYGCEPWIEAARVAREKYGQRIQIKAFHKDLYKNQTFRVVVLWSLIEHVTQPKRLIQDIYSIMQPKGWIVITTPNFDSFSRKLLQGRWHLFERPHLTYFQPKTLSALLESHGFSVVDIKVNHRIYPLIYFSDYLSKWSKGLSQFSTKIIRIFNISNRMLRLPSGSMTVFAQKK